MGSDSVTRNSSLVIHTFRVPNAKSGDSASDNDDPAALRASQRQPLSKNRGGRKYSAASGVSSSAHPLLPLGGKHIQLRVWMFGMRGDHGFIDVDAPAGLRRDVEVAVF
jgi:hypothetical protein